MQRNTISLTEGSIWKGMLYFALPILLGNIFQQFYNTFDSWVVGRFLGDTALAAVGSSGSLIFMMIAFFNGLSMGAGVIIARHFGARDFGAMSKAIHTDIAMGLITGLFLTAFGIGMTPAILRWMGTPEAVRPLSTVYFRYYFLGSLFTVMYNIFVGILHALGDSKHPLYYLMISTAVNVVLDLVFVGVFHWSVGSAAIATTISQGLSALLCFVHMLRLTGPAKISIRKISFHIPSLRTILRLGFPSGIQNSVIAIANLVIQANINSFGAAAMAGCGSYSKLEGFAFLPVTCFSMALTTFVSQNLGAGNHARVKKGITFGIACSTITAECIGILAYLFAPQLIRFFNGSPEVIDFGSRHMRCICLFYCLLAFSHCVAGIMRGAGKASVPMYTMLVCWCLIRVSYVTIGLRFFPMLETISFAYPLTWTLSSIIFLAYLLKGNWLYGSLKLDK